MHRNLEKWCLSLIFIVFSSYLLASVNIPVARDLWSSMPQFISRETRFENVSSVIKDILKICESLRLLEVG